MDILSICQFTTKRWLSRIRGDDTLLVRAYAYCGYNGDVQHPRYPVAYQESVFSKVVSQEINQYQQRELGLYRKGSAEQCEAPKYVSAETDHEYHEPH